MTFIQHLCIHVQVCVSHGMCGHTSFSETSLWSFTHFLIRLSFIHVFQILDPIDTIWNISPYFWSFLSLVIIYMQVYTYWYNNTLVSIVGNNYWYNKLIDFLNVHVCECTPPCGCAHRRVTGCHLLKTVSPADSPCHLDQTVWTVSSRELPASDCAPTPVFACLAFTWHQASACRSHDCTAGTHYPWSCFLSLNALLLSKKTTLLGSQKFFWSQPAPWSHSHL